MTAILEVARASREEGMTVVVTSHDPRTEGGDTDDEVIRLAKGRIVESR